MSNIFDALQRSEAERSGMEFSALPKATELLERAERQAASRWKSAALPEQPEARETAERRRPLGPEPVPPVAAAMEALVDAGPAPTDEDPDIVADILGQFQSLQTTLSPESRLVCITDKESAATESFRLLGVRLRRLRRDWPLKKVLITSTIPQEGKSVTSANLACALASGTQLKVLLIEGDVRRPSLSSMFGLGKIPGLCEWLRGERTLAASIYRLEDPGFWIFPAGSAPGNPLELLQSGKLPALMDQLSAWFDWIVIDSPPVLPVADTSVWTRFADGILLVTRQGTTEKRQLERGLEAVESKKLIGAVLNSSKRSSYSDYYYRYSAGSQSTGSSTK